MSRILSLHLLTSPRYYVLVAACIFARKEQWLKGACLAATLLFPAVAAIHGIVLAAVHVKGGASATWNAVCHVTD